MRESAIFACLIGPGPQDSIVESFIGGSLMAGSHVEPAQISELRDAYKVRIRCLRGNVECGQPRTVCVKSLWNGRAEVLAGSDAVVQHASLTDLGLCEDAPNADTAKLSCVLLVVLSDSAMQGLLTSVGLLSKSFPVSLPGRC